MGSISTSESNADIRQQVRPASATGLTLSDVPRHYARLHGTRAKPAVLADDGNRTWPQIDEAADKVAAYLHHVGLTKGSRVALLLPNGPLYVEIIFGIARAGMVSVPLSPRFVKREVEHCLSFAEVEALVTSVDLLHEFEDVVSSAVGLPADRVITIDGAPGNAVDYRAILEGASSVPVDVEICDEDVCWMPFTSGTSGTAKAALVTHRALVDHWNLVIREFDIRRDETMLIAGPFYHSLGFVFALACLYAQGRILVHTKFEPGDVLRAIGDHGVTVMPAAPTMYTMMLASPERAFAELNSMRTVISAGSPLLTSTKLGLLELFAAADLYEFYGSTETGIISKLAPNDQRRKVRSVGQPVLGVEIRILDEDGCDVAPGEVGEIFKRGMILAPEYFRNPDATRALFADEWMTAGDLGRIDDEGYLFIVDRKKDMIITGGVNVFPSEVEEVIARHEAVAEVAVIGTPDPQWGERVTAVVVTRAGATVTDVEIFDACRTELAPEKRPRAVIFVDALPKTASGKVLKRELRDANCEPWLRS